MTKRKFYRTVVEVEILSENPLEDATDLQAISYEITQGDCSGHVTVISEQAVSGRVMAKLLQNQGSDPGFFQLEAL